MANDLILLGAGRSGSSGGESLPVTVFSDDFERASSALGGVANGWSDPSTGWQISTISGSQRATGPGGGYHNPKLMRAVAAGRCVISATIPYDTATPVFIFKMGDDYQSGCGVYGSADGSNVSIGPVGFSGGTLGSPTQQGIGTVNYDTGELPTGGFLRMKAFFLSEGRVAVAYYDLAESLPCAISQNNRLRGATGLNVGFTPFASSTKCIDDFSVVTQVATTRAIAVGDSITDFGWAEFAQVYTGQSWDWYSRAAAGYTLDDLYDDYAVGTLPAPLSSVQTLITGSTIPVKLVIAGGSNDLMYGGTAAALKTVATNYATAADSDGVDEIWICTLLPRTDGSGADNTHFETQRLIYNADLLINYAAMGYTGVVDWSGVTEMDDTTDTQKYIDLVHPTGWGAMFIAKCVSDAIT